MAVHLLYINIVFEIHFDNIICTLPSSPYKSRTPFNVRLIHYIFTGQENFHCFLPQKKYNIVQNNSCKGCCPWSKLSCRRCIYRKDHRVISCSVKTLHWLFIREIKPRCWANLTYMVVILSCIMEWCGPIGIGDRVFSTIFQQQRHHSGVTYHINNMYISSKIF